ncbi:MAG: hypothetical protein ACI841_000628 [Planctomycetota bacterium]|jgi:hypothetical protein
MATLANNARLRAPSSLEGFEKAGLIALPQQVPDREQAALAVEQPVLIEGVLASSDAMEQPLRGLFEVDPNTGREASACRQIRERCSGQEGRRLGARLRCLDRARRRQAQRR